MSNLTMADLVKVHDEIRKLGRVPRFYYSHYAVEILHGPMIDIVFGERDPLFDRGYHKAYLIPIQHRSIIEERLNG